MQGIACIFMTSIIIHQYRKITTKILLEKEILFSFVSEINKIHAYLIGLDRCSYVHICK